MGSFKKYVCSKSVGGGQRNTYFVPPLNFSWGGCGVSKKHLAGGWENSVKAWGDGDLAF